MKKLFFLALLVVVMQPHFALAVTQITVTPDPVPTANAQTIQPAQTQGSCTNCNLGYTPLEPIPGLNSPNLVAPGSLPAIINAIFTILITAGALIAVLSLTIGGIQYMTSASATLKNAGIKRAQASMWAMLLIAGTWLILHTVNPALLNFSLNPCPSGSSGCTVSGYSIPNTTLSNTANTGTTFTPYTGALTNTTNSTDLGTANGCTNAGGTWQMFTNTTGGWSTGGTCQIGARQTGVGNGSSP